MTLPEKESHQPLLPSFEPPPNIARRMPRGRKGETPQAYHVRFMTWYNQRWTPKRRATRQACDRAWQKSRQRLARSAKEFGDRALIQAKTGGRLKLAGAVWFWYGPGGIARPSAHLAQYLHVGSLRYLVGMGTVSGEPPRC